MTQPPADDVTPPSSEASGAHAPTPAPDVSMLLQQLGERPDDARRGELFEVVYAQLHGLAQRHMRGERAGHSLQATVLVHEAWMRLAGHDPAAWRNRAHVLGLSSLAMRRVLVDHARSKQRGKRGGGAAREICDLDALASESGVDGALDLVALNDALEKLERTRDEISEDGGQVAGCFAAELRDEAAVSDLVARAVGSFGPINGLVGAAGGLLCVWLALRVARRHPAGVNPGVTGFVTALSLIAAGLLLTGHPPDNPDTHMIMRGLGCVALTSFFWRVLRQR